MDIETRTLKVNFESRGWGLLPSCHRWQFFRLWMRFIRDPRAVALTNLRRYEVRMYHEFAEVNFFPDGDDITTSPIVRIEKVSYPREDVVLMRAFDWLFWPRRQEGSFRIFMETGSVITVPFRTIMDGTASNLRAARWGAPDELVWEP